MLSDDNPVLSSPQPPEFGHPLHPSHVQAVPEAHRASRGSSGSQGNGYGSPRQELERRAVTPNPPSVGCGSQQQQQSSPFDLSTPKPSLPPFPEYHSGYSDADLESSPCPSPSPFGPSRKHLHRRQQSFPNLFPLALRSQSRTPSPTRKTHQRYPSEQMPYTGEGRIRQRAEGPRSGLAGWLSGTAAGSALGMTPNSSNNSIDARTNNSSHTGTTPTSGGNMNIQLSETADVTPTRQPHRTATAAAAEPPTPKTATTPAGGTMTSRFMSAFTSRFTTPSTPTTSTKEANDELLSLDIEAALFPPNSPSVGGDRDSFSPAAFKNFQMNAIGLLTKYQTAYKAQSVTIRDLQSERSAQKDELEEAETRAKHLKFQLEGMAKELAEQEKKMRALAEELQMERERNKAPSVVLSEDLGVDKIRKRKSGESWSGEDEADEVESAESESVFSRCRSPTSTIPAVPETPVQGQFSQQSRLGTPMTATPRQQQQQQKPTMNAFQKIFKGMTGDGGLEGGCTNCKGQDASVAWDTVGLLRDENRQLKVRVGELEGVVEGALDLVNGIGM